MNEKQTGGGSKIKKSQGAAGCKNSAPENAPRTARPAAEKSAPTVSGGTAGKNIRINGGEKASAQKTAAAPQKKTGSPGAAKQPSKTAAKTPAVTKTSGKSTEPAKKSAEKAPAEQNRRAVHTDINEVRRNEHSIRVLKRVMAVLIVVLIGLIVYMTYPHWIAKLEGLFDRPVRTEFGDGSTEGGNFPLEPDNAVTGVYTVKNDLLTSDPHTLTFYDVNGEKKSSYSHNFSKPIIRTAGKRVLVFDSGAFGFKLYKKGGETYSKTVDDTILTGAVCETGTAAIVTTSNKFAASARIFDKDGKLIYNYDCTARIMSVSLTPDGESCYVCTFYSGDGELRSQVRRIDLDKSGEQMVSEEIPSLALGCMVNEAGDIMVACDTAFYLLGADGKLKSEYKYDGELVSYDMGPSGAAVLLSGSVKDSGKLMIAQPGAEGSAEFRELSSDSAVKSVKVCGNRVILLGSSKVYAFDFTGALTAASDIGREYSSFTFIDKALYLLGRHGIDKIKFSV